MDLFYKIRLLSVLQPHRQGQRARAAWLTRRYFREFVWGNGIGFLQGWVPPPWIFWPPVELFGRTLQAILLVFPMFSSDPARARGIRAAARAYGIDDRPAGSPPPHAFLPAMHPSLEESNPVALAIDARSRRVVLTRYSRVGVPVLVHLLHVSGCGRRRAVFARGRGAEYRIQLCRPEPPHQKVAESPHLQVAASQARSWWRGTGARTTGGW